MNSTLFPAAKPCDRLLFARRVGKSVFRGRASICSRPEKWSTQSKKTDDSTEITILRFINFYLV